MAGRSPARHRSATQRPIRCSTRSGARHDRPVTDFLTREQLAHRTSAAVQAAVGTGRDLGLTVTEPRLLHDLSSVVVHLAPSPVVARIPTVLPESTSLESLAARQHAELDVTRWLQEQGVPVLPPSPLVPRRPVQRDGFSMTWFAPHRRRRRLRRRVPRRGGQAPRRQPELHPHGLPAGLERGGDQLRLPLPRFPVRHPRQHPQRPGGHAPAHRRPRRRLTPPPGPAARGGAARTPAGARVSDGSATDATSRGPTAGITGTGTVPLPDPLGSDTTREKRLDCSRRISPPSTL